MHRSYPDPTLKRLHLTLGALGTLLVLGLLWLAARPHPTAPVRVAFEVAPETPQPSSTRPAPASVDDEPPAPEGDVPELATVEPPPAAERPAPAQSTEPEIVMAPEPAPAVSEAREPEEREATEPPPERALEPVAQAEPVDGSGLAHENAGADEALAADDADAVALQLDGDVAVLLGPTAQVHGALSPLVCFTEHGTAWVNDGEWAAQANAEAWRRSRNVGSSYGVQAAPDDVAQAAVEIGQAVPSAADARLERCFRYLPAQVEQALASLADDASGVVRAELSRDGAGWVVRRR